MDLDKIGLQDGLISYAIRKEDNILLDLNKRMEKDVSEDIGTNHELSLLNNGVRTYYDFIGYSYCLGNSTIDAEFKNIPLYKEKLNNGKTRYYYKGEADIEFSDAFTDPLSFHEVYDFSENAFVNLFGKPYKITGNWEWELEGEIEK